jgi:hypothetical protein
MDEWKGIEAETISLYEDVNILPPGAVVPHRNKYVDDGRSSLSDNLTYELKQCFSTYHHWGMYEMGYSANEIAYVRTDQLERYRKADMEEPDHTRLIWIDCRILDLTHYSIINVGNYIKRVLDEPYEILRRWSVSITTAEELWKIRNKTCTSVVPEKRRKHYSNNPSWDGALTLLPTTELTTVDLTPKIGAVGMEKLMRAKQL